MTKAKIQPWHKKFLCWIESIRDKVRSNGITFDCQLVGSAKRHLVIPHHNKGFDLDFQIILHKNKNKLDEKELKSLFINLLNPLVTAKGFEHCKDSTSAITIKMVDEEKAKIKVGYDIVILKIHKTGETEQTKVLRHHKKPQHESWSFELLPDMTDAGKQFGKIKGEEMWQDLRERYYKKKTENTDDKKSFQLLHEAVNETLQKFGVK